MRCASCDANNTAEARFCTACGAALQRACPACGKVNEPAARFCGHCGAAFAPAPAPGKVAAHAEGALKHITVLFADVLGSTQLIEGLDPEQAAERLAPALEAMQEAVRRFEGTVARVQGDGIMAFFGTPKPQEDHAVRACCAGLALQAAVKALPCACLPVRVGIHSGEVLARTIETDFSTDLDATGITVHIASRLEGLAPAGAVVLSSATRQAARQFVSVQAMGPQAVRGLSAPFDIFLLTGLRRGPTTQRFISEEGRSGFVGREREMALLDRGLERAGEGDGCAIGVVAEAGVGKSRLCFEFAERCRAAGARVLEGRALAHSRAMPFEPVIDVIEGAVRDHARRCAASRHGKDRHTARPLRFHAEGRTATARRLSRHRGPDAVA